MSAGPAGQLAGKVGLITGATAGIGAAAAVAMAAAGAEVTLVGRRRELGEALVADIGATGGRASFVQADVRVSEQVDAMVATVIERHGRVDFAFNNAGIFDRMRPLHDYGDAEWDDLLSANLSSVFRCLRAEIAAMIEHGGGVIVNNASTVATRGSDRASPGYVAAKHGVLGLTRQAAVQYVDQGIRVNAVSPGPTATDVAKPLLAEGPEAVRTAMASLNPTGAFVLPEHVAAAVVYLCSDAAVMVNGHELVLDGGQLAGM